MIRFGWILADYFKVDACNMQLVKILIDRTHTFFIMPVFRFEKVVYRRSLLSINSIFILTLPLVFFPFGGKAFFGFVSELLLLLLLLLEELLLLLLLLLLWLWWAWLWWLLLTIGGFPPPPPPPPPLPPPLALKRWPKSAPVGELWLWLVRVE